MLEALELVLISALGLFLLYRTERERRSFGCLAPGNICLVIMYFVFFLHLVITPNFQDVLVSTRGMLFAKYMLFVSFVLILLGKLLGDLVFLRENRRFRRRLRYSRITIYPYRKYYKFAMLLLLVISLMYYIGVVSSGPAIDPFKLLLGQITAEEYKNIRFGIGERLGGLRFLVELEAKFVYVLLPFMVPLTVIAYKNRYVSLFYVVILLAIIYFTLITGHKQRYLLAFVYVTTFVALLMFWHRPPWYFVEKARVRHLLLGLIGGHLVLGYLYTTQYEFMDFTAGVEAAAYRTSTELFRIFQVILHLYPETLPHSFGLTSSVIAGLVGEEARQTALILPREIYGLSFDTAWPTYFLGDAWADFGYLGIVVLAPIVGLIFSYFNSTAYLLLKSDLGMPYFMGSLVAGISFIQLNFFTALLTGGVGVALALSYYLRRKARKMLRARASGSVV